MINNVADLKDRALVESNTLKSLILYSSNGYRQPSRDDILIHDYQIANSVTMNQILSNYIVNLNYAGSLLLNSDESSAAKYFTMVKSLEEDDIAQLDGNTRLVLNAKDGQGSFQSMRLEYDVKQILPKDGTVGFVNLDSVWYGIVRTNRTEDTGDVDFRGNPIIVNATDYLGEPITYDSLVIIDGMNDFLVNPNPFNGNPFADEKTPLLNEELDGITFNEFIHQLCLKYNQTIKINCIVENMFQGNIFDETYLGGEPDQKNLGQVISACRYIVCLTCGLYGLRMVYRKYGTISKFIGMHLYDIGAISENLDPQQYAAGMEYEFLECGFHSIGEQNTMFIVFKEKNWSYPWWESSSSSFLTEYQVDVDESQDIYSTPAEIVGEKYHYVFLNDDSYDKAYGFSSIDSVVIDQMMFDPDKVFTKVETIKTLDTISIAMTNYGFWDIEPNETKEIVYSFRGEDKSHSYCDWERFNGHKSKMVEPTAYDYDEDSLNSAFPDKVTEYDKVWKLDEDGKHYKCHYTGNVLTKDEEEHPEHKNDLGIYDFPRYAKEVVGFDNQKHPFAGGTKSFAIYNVSGSAGSDEPYIFASMNEHQARRLIFSSPTLVNPFIDWLYRQIVHQPLDDEETGASHDGLGEYFLYNRHSDIVGYLNSLIHSDGDFKRFSNLMYQIPKNDAVVSKFESAQKIVGDETGTLGLYCYCSTLSRLIGMEYDSPMDGLAWVLGLGDATQAGNQFKQKITQWFLQRKAANQEAGDYLQHLEPFVDSVLSDLQKEFPQLSYFNPYLKTVLMHDLDISGFKDESPTVYLLEDSISETVKSAQQFLDNQFQTTMVLGRYDSSEEGNSRYPGFDQYIYQNNVNLGLSEVQDVMSPIETKNEVFAAVKSMQFFSQNNTYDSMKTSVNSTLESTLFKIDENAEFVKESGLVSTSSNDRYLNVNWDVVKDWLFDTITEVDMLKAFIRTQIYRPLFFKYNNYDNFSSDTSAYKCETKKTFIDHAGETKPLVLDANYDVDASSSGLDGVVGEYSIANIRYYRQTNVLTYSINYSEIGVKDNKFVHGDVEFYVIRPTDQDRVTSIYFNEFQNQVNRQNSEVKIVDNKFVLNGVEYSIAAGRISIDSAPDDFTGDLEKFSQEIVDGKFNLDGVWYVLEGNNGEYTKARFAELQDNALRQILITQDGYGEYRPLGISFKFVEGDSSIDWNILQITRQYQTVAMDSVVNEWCKFDENQELELTDDKTFEWYIANELADIETRYPSLKTNIVNLDGVIYNGNLLDVECTLQLSNEVSGGGVLTKGVLSKSAIGSDETTTQDIGLLFDNGFNQVSNKILTGTMEDGLVNESQDGSQTFIMKDQLGGKNNCNCVWMPKDAWNSCWHVDFAGTTSQDIETKKITVSFNDNIENAPECIILTPIVVGDNSSEVFTYRVTTRNDDSGSYIVNKDENTVHVVANGDRYAIDLQAGTVQKLVFIPVPVNTMDFSTQYTLEHLLDNLLTNIKQYMMNAMVQQILVNGASQHIDIEPSHDLNLFLDLFTDYSSLENFQFSQRQRNLLSEEKRKFQQVFKNNLFEIDESSIYIGKVYSYLQRKIQQTFNDAESIVLVSKPSINAARSENKDTFSYDVRFDLNLKAKKTVLANNKLLNGESYTISNATMKDVECRVTFIPEFKPGDDSPMKYRIKYDFVNKTYEVVYDQISYTYEGIIKTKSIVPKSIQYPLSVVNPAITDAKPISVIANPQEFVSAKVNDVFGDIRSSIVKEVNNSIHANDAGLGDEDVEAVQVLNEGITEKTWGLGVQIGGQTLSPDQVKCTYVSYGRTMIDGKLYGVSADSTALEELGGNSSYDVISKYAHINFGDNETELVWAAISSEPLVENDYLSSGFQLFSLEDGSGISQKYLEFRNPYMSNLGLSNKQSYNGLKYSDINDIGKYWISLNVSQDVLEFDSFSIWLIPEDSNESDQPDNLQTDSSIDSDDNLPNNNVTDPNAVGPDLSTESQFTINWITLAEDAWVKHAGNNNDLDVNSDTQRENYMQTTAKDTIDIANDSGYTSYSFDVYMNAADSDDSSGDNTPDTTTPEEGEGVAVGESDASDEEITVPGFEDDLTENAPTTDNQGEQETRYWLKGKVTVQIRKKGVEQYELKLDKENSRGAIGFVAPPFENDPQKRYYTAAQEYKITGLSGVEYEFQDLEEGESERKLNQVRFKVSVEYGKCDVFLKPSTGNGYVSGVYYVTPDSVTNVIQVTDLNEKSASGLGYGCAYCPVDIPTEQSMAALQSLDDLDYRSLYFTLDSSDNFTSGGHYCPCLLHVLEYEKTMENEGDIYDRYYESERTIVAKRALINSIENNDTWIDATATSKSIRSVESDTTWKNLIQVNGQDDEVVPESMREKVTDLVSGKLRLTDEYFKTIMQQFQTFLELIQTELTRTIDASQLSNIFQFRYNADVKYMLHTQDQTKWNKSGDTVEQSGLFSLDHSGDEYRDCLKLFNDHLYGQFFADYSQLDQVSGVDIGKRDYGLILQSVVSKDQSSLAHYINRDYPISSANDIYTIRGDLFKVLYENLNGSVDDEADIVEDIYGKWNLVYFVKLINAIKTMISGTIIEVVVSDGYCNIFTQVGESIMWYRMDAGQDNIDFLLDNKIMSAGNDYQYTPAVKQLEYLINPDGDWLVKTMNRDFSRLDKTNIQDSIAVLCQGLDQNDNGFPLWYLTHLDVYVKCNSWEEIVDMAYEQKGDSLYVLFKGDNHVYRFDSILDLRDLNDIVLLQKENATMKIATLHSVLTTDKQIQYDYIYLNYYDNLKNPEDLNSVNTIDSKKWEIKLFGKAGRHVDYEVWGGSPGKKYDHFRQYNTILFGDSLFNQEQLRFQNISKNKDMYDILDVDEVDGCYYGLFRDESTETLEKNLGYDTFTVFKTQSRQSQNLTGITEWNMDQDVSSNKERENMPVQRLNYNIISPHLYRSADGLYSLYVLAKVEDDSYPEGYRVRFQEISVPDSEVYSDRRIEIQNLLANSDQVDMTGGLHVNEVIMSSFKPMNLGSSFFVLSDKGFHKILCTNPLKQMSIDNLEGEGGLKDALKKSLFGSIMKKHLDERHSGDQADYFDVLAGKINQFEEGFNIFQCVPAEFSYTQDIGVIPDSKIDDTDVLKDHRVDSVYATTDILWQGGMAVDASANPGIITAAVSNPATTYDNARVFSKSQRNPSIQSTEFYDYIYDADGNVLMDLYSIPFIYRINSNNTYDLYINVPTTRTKYLNRIAGTLNADLTTQVKVGDTRTRRNFLNQRLVNNLDESTTRLRIYIDKKYISIGNVEQVEISGNSIPLEIYRDAVNNGNYDSIALESRWDGNVVDVYNSENDINKIMLEFECYGTDSQSIHIQGKTLINHVLDDKKYKYA